MWKDVNVSMIILYGVDTIVSLFCSDFNFVLFLQQLSIALLALATIHACLPVQRGVTLKAAQNHVMNHAWKVVNALMITLCGVDTIVSREKIADVSLKGFMWR